MKKILLPLLLLAILCPPVLSQERHKPKPEEEEAVKPRVVQEETKANQNPIRRTRVHQTSFRRLGGISIGLLNVEYMGFGATYEINRHAPLSWSFTFQYFPIPSKQLYFDYYYYQFVQRNKGSIWMIYASAKYDLPIMKKEPNINPYGVVGVGPVMGIENDLTRQWPGSITHAFTVGGFTTFGGAGVEYRMNSWVLGFDARYQFVRFPNRIFARKEFDGFTLGISVGKLF